VKIQWRNLSNCAYQPAGGTPATNDAMKCGDPLSGELILISSVGLYVESNGRLVGTNFNFSPLVVSDHSLHIPFYPHGFATTEVNKFVYKKRR
jgi:hypothetical protein